jgi:hypothetical protein
MDFLISYILFIVHPSPNADGLDIAPNIAIYPDEAYSNVQKYPTACIT